MLLMDAQSSAGIVVLLLEELGVEDSGEALLSTEDVARCEVTTLVRRMKVAFDGTQRDLEMLGGPPTRSSVFDCRRHLLAEVVGVGAHADPTT